jgi:purine nucleosidase/ribosylpyrimidine nucleosidase
VPRKLILDVDTGTDDAVAIMLAALHPELDLVGVTTVNGNAPVERTTDNTLRVLDHIGRPDIPVHPGLHRPLVRLGFPEPERHARDGGEDSHGTELPLPAPRGTASDVGAVEYLVETYRATTEEITLVPVAPLSNIAAALAVEPRMVEAVPEVVVMGGGHAVGGATPSAEFNIWADPEAAAMVFAAGFRRITLVPLDATHRALVSRADCDRLAASGTPAGTAAAELVRRRIDAHVRGHGVVAQDAAPVHDALCIAYLVRPGVITTRLLHVAVETEGPLTVGRTVMDTRPQATTPPNCSVAFDADAAAFVGILQETLTRGGVA